MLRIGRTILCCGLLIGCGQRPAVVEDDSNSPVVTNSIGMKLALIPAGEFLMGSPDRDGDAPEDEKPQHRVRITWPFYMGVYEVTQDEYRQVTGKAASFFTATGHGKDKVAGLDTGRFPAEQIRWADAVDFCRLLSERPEEKAAGRIYRLPAEAEWEYACRAGTATAFHCGDSLSSHQANFNGNHPYGGAAKGPFLVRTTTVGSYPPNAFGLHDMHGNVWEWCSDWYGLNYYRESPLDDPPGPATGSMRVIRGGEWYAEGRDCRSAFRYADLPNGIFYVMGFRVVMTIGGQPQPVPPTTVAAKSTEPAPVVDLPKETAQTGGEDWPQWRGPRSDGTWSGPKLAEQWPASGLPRLWRQPLGGGYSGIAVVAGRVYTQDYQKAPKELERILCFDAATGKPLWSLDYPVEYGSLPYGNGPRATPTVRDGRVYAVGALGHLHCLDAATGKPVWSKHLVHDLKATMPGWGFAGSPVRFEELVILHAGGEPDACLLALDRHTGDAVWRSLPDPGGYATPLLVQSHGQWQVVAWTQNHVRGVEARTGKPLWAVPFEVTYGTAIASPVFHDGMAFVSGYYEGSKAIRLGPEPAAAEIVWEDRRNLRGVMANPLVRAGHGFLLDKRDGLVCFDWPTGKKLWDDGNRTTPKGRNSHASLVWLGDADRALILNSEGNLVLARLNPAGFQELARARIIGPTWAHPAFAGRHAFARNDSELVCVALPGK